MKKEKTTKGEKWAFYNSWILVLILLVTIGFDRAFPYTKTVTTINTVTNQPDLNPVSEFQQAYDAHEPARKTQWELRVLQAYITNRISGNAPYRITVFANNQSNGYPIQPIWLNGSANITQTFNIPINYGMYAFRFEAWTKGPDGLPLYCGTNDADYYNPRKFPIPPTDYVFPINDPSNPLGSNNLQGFLKYEIIQQQ